MKCDQLAQATVAKCCPQWTLDQINVRPVISFDQARACCRDRNIPSDDHPIVKSRVGPSNELTRIGPHWERSATDWGSSDWMAFDPTLARVEARVCRLAQPASNEIDRSGNCASMHIIDRYVCADGHL